MTLNELRTTSRTLLERLRESEPSSVADDLLLFLNRLRDAFPQEPTAWMHDLIHSLEANPDSALASDDRRRMLILFLEDCSNGRFPRNRGVKQRIQ